MIKPVKTKLAGWGNYPVEEGFLFRPDNGRDVLEILQSGLQNNYIAFGMGRSYGDTPLNKQGGVLLTTQLNRILSFDEMTGVLECEAGVTFEDIINVFLPRGYFLPVTPGTKYVTLGGAIANDVHGKNHHLDGCVSSFILDFKLMLASGEIIDCSREHNADIFWATIGGIGLTGIILSARIQLEKVESAYYDVLYEKAPNIERALELFAESDDKYKFSVAWIDCLARGSSLGKSVLMRGNYAPAASLRSGIEPLKLKSGPKLAIPFDFPSFALNNLSIKSFNTLYYGVNKNVRKTVYFDSFFYPLDSIYKWNRMYGKKGFVQYQAVFPPEGKEGLIQMLERLSSSNRSSFLAVLKTSGEQNPGLLSFPKKGYTLALDIPIKDESLFTFLHELDELVIRYGGRVYLAKDSELLPEHFAEMYPRLKEFRAIKDRIDPNHIFSSSMARRLGIVEE
ncbi:FAD-binding oxidoreductase [Aneurinibacillus aneurinilyticus]|uniref:FAD-binding oxidoreductase n=1 Tax=Aneurinibacillus aneurinilyticus TaxID=1391 RepID=UPI0036732951